VSEELQDYENNVHSTSAAVIYADGSAYDIPYLRESQDKTFTLAYNPLDFFRLVDVFAKEYSLGGCRSLTEFADMIDNEDPQLLEGLLYSIRKRYEDSDDTDSGNTGTHTTTGIPKRKTSPNFKQTWGHDSDMLDFLGTSGMEPAALKEAQERLKSRKITPKEQREFHQWLYSQVTPEKLRDPNFDLKGALAKIHDYMETTEKFNLSAHTIFGRKK